MFQSRRGLLLAAAMIVFGLAAAASDAADSPQKTVMEVGEMCSGCVKKITTRLEKMPGIGKIECDIAKKTVTVSPAAGQNFTAIALWDAMAEIGKTPRKLAGPSGTYTARPKA